MQAIKFSVTNKQPVLKKPINRVKPPAAATPKKKCTLNQKHTEKINDFKLQHETLPAKIKKLDTIKLKLHELETSQSNPLDNTTSHYTTIDHKMDLYKEKDRLEREIENIERGKDSFAYFNRTDDILLDYYVDNDQYTDSDASTNSYSNDENEKDVSDDDATDACVNSSHVTNPKANSGLVNSGLVNSDHVSSSHITNPKDEIATSTQATSPPQFAPYASYQVASSNQPNKRSLLYYLNKNNPNTNQSPLVTQDAVSKKAKLYTQYINVTSNDTPTDTTVSNTICTINDCGGTKLINTETNVVVCTRCCLSEPINYSDKKYQHELIRKKQDTNAYKRINHLKEILSQLQANETTTIDDQVYIMIDLELKRRHINKNKLDIFSLRTILKRLEKREYYEHVSSILQKVNGKQPPTFTREDEKTITEMFKNIQQPFEMFKPKIRKNFFTYSYVLHKFCLILGLEQYLYYFPLLKSSKKLAQYDKVWKNICLYLGWKYHKSI